MASTLQIYRMLKARGKANQEQGRVGMRNWAARIMSKNIMQRHEEIAQRTESNGFLQDEVA